MKNRKKVAVVGGSEAKYHDFNKLGPVFDQFIRDYGYDVTLTEDLDLFLPQNIQPYAALICCTTGRQLTLEQEAGLLNAVRDQAKCFIGIHGAAASFSQNLSFIKMLGGRFITHPPLGPSYQFKVIDQAHAVTREIKDFTLVDELYIMKTYPPFQTLITCLFQGLEQPIAWVKSYGSGRVFYCALGHDVEQVSASIFQKLVINGLDWGVNKLQS